MDSLLLLRQPVFLSHPWPLGCSAPCLCLTREFPPSFPVMPAKLEFGTSSGVKTGPKGGRYRVKAQERIPREDGACAASGPGLHSHAEANKRLLLRDLGARVEQLGSRRIGDQNGPPASHGSRDKALRVLIHFLFTLPGRHL